MDFAKRTETATDTVSMASKDIEDLRNMLKSFLEEARKHWAPKTPKVWDAAKLVGESLDLTGRDVVLARINNTTSGAITVYTSGSPINNTINSNSVGYVYVFGASSMTFEGVGSGVIYVRLFNPEAAMFPGVTNV